MELSKKIREMRKLKNLKQEDLANACCVTRSAVANWEAGRRRPDWDNLIILAKLFGITVEELVGEELIYYENPTSSVPIKKGKKLIYMMPIINTIISITLVIILLIILLYNAKDKSNIFDEKSIKDIQHVALQLESDNKTYTLYFKEKTTNKSNTKIFELNNTLISKKQFTKYQYCSNKIFIFNIVIQFKISEYSLKHDSSKLLKINDNKNKLELLEKYNLPYISQPGVYNVLLIIESGLCYIGAFPCF